MLRFDQLFPAIVACLCFIAAAVYFWQGEWRLGVIWTCYGLVDVVLIV